MLSSPIFPALAQELHAEATWDARFGGVLAQWCGESLGQKANMEDALQRRLDEADIALRQLEFEEQRLVSEEKLVNLTLTEQKKQISDTASAAELATTDFEAEQRELIAAMEAANHADRVVQMEGETPKARADPGSTQPSMDEDLGAGDAQFSGEAPRPRLRRQQILLLRSRLEKARNAAATDDEAMMEQLRRLSTDQGAALLQTQLRAASLRVEVAQRRRERQRLTARRSDFTEILEALRRSRPVHQQLCDDEGGYPGELLGRIGGISRTLELLHEKAEQQRRPVELLTRVGAMSQALESILGQAAAVAAVEPALNNAAPSLLQVSAASKSQAQAASKGKAKVGVSFKRTLNKALANLKDLSWRFPEESAWYTAAAQRLSAGASMAASDVAVDVPEVGPDGSKSAATSGNGGKALNDLRQFLDSSALDGNGEEGDSASFGSPAVDQVTPVFSALINHVRAKERTVEGRSGSCQFLERSIADDTAALMRVQRRAEKRLGVVQATAQNYKDDGEYALVQRGLIEAQLRRLADLEGEVSRWTPHSSSQLQTQTEALVNLASSLASEPLAGPMVQELSKQVALQQDSLMMRKTRLSARRKALEATDNQLMTLLELDAKRRQRRLVHLQPEVMLWSALSHTKDAIQMMSENFRKTADGLCSKDSLNSLGKKERELEEEEAALHSMVARSRKGLQPSTRS